MVRVGGMGYSIDVSKSIGERISNMTFLTTGTPIEAARNYTVGGWASVNEETKGPAIYDLVADYLRKEKVVNVPENNNIKVSGA
jgi:sulfur-oxidizing protein SoxB